MFEIGANGRVVTCAVQVQLAGDAARAALVHNRRLTKMAVALKAELDKKTQRLACMPK